MRVVLDTNVYISALMFGGAPGILLDLALAGGLQLIVSPALLDELRDKLIGKFGLDPLDVQVILAKLTGVAALVSPTESLRVVADDPDDDRVLECAIAGNADAIISGDRHLLALGAFQEIPILKVRDCLTLLDKGTASE